jgi:hypothetical protein
MERFHNVDYPIFLCSQHRKVSLNDAWEFADGIDSDERARSAADRGFVEDSAGAMIIHRFSFRNWQ